MLCKRHVRTCSTRLRSTLKVSLWGGTSGESTSRACDREQSSQIPNCPQVLASSAQRLAMTPSCHCERSDAISRHQLIIFSKRLWRPTEEMPSSLRSARCHQGIKRRQNNAAPGPEKPDKAHRKPPGKHAPPPEYGSDRRLWLRACKEAPTRIRPSLLSR